MKAIIYTRADDFLSLKEDWASLHDRTEEKSIFIDFDWAYCIWLNLPSDKKLQIITIWDGDKLISLLPLVILREQIIWKLSCTFLQHLCCRYSDHSIILTDKNYSRKDLLKITVKEISKLACKVDFLKFDNLSCAHSNSRIFLKLLRSLPGQSIHYINVENPILDLAEKNAIDTKQLKDTERRLKNLMKTHHVEICIEKEIESSVWEKLVTFHRARFFGSGFSSDENQAFYKKLMQSNFDSHQFEFSYMLVDGEARAIHFGFKKDKTVYYYLPAYDAGFQSYGVGQILLMEIIKHYQRQEYIRFDMLRGSEPYKYAWMSDEYHNISFISVGVSNILNKSLIYIFALKKTFSRLKSC